MKNPKPLISPNLATFFMCRKSNSKKLQGAAGR
jgi:hypothetical protein